MGQLRLVLLPSSGGRLHATRQLEALLASYLVNSLRL